jgi:signal peptidase I
MLIWCKKMLKGNLGFLCFISLMLVFRSAVADWNSVPTGSMLPTIVEGDRIWVDKLAYDVRLPFTHISLKHLGDPARGDIIVFDSAAAGKTMVKRVVALPGDRVQMRDNRLTINGQALAYRLEEMSLQQQFGGWEPEEDLLGVLHSIRLGATQSPLANFDAVTVPAGHYLVLGDNRDNSADSRVIGFIPRNEILGRTRSVVLSLDYEDYYLPRKARFFHPLAG